MPETDEFFICDLCGEAYTKDPSTWSDADAERLAEKDFGRPLVKEERAVVCSGCYQKFMRLMGADE